MKHLGFWSIFSALVGIGLSFFADDRVVAVAEVVSKGFMNLLKFISLPVIFFSLAATIANLGDGKHVGKVLSVTLRYALFTTGIAALVALLLYQFIDPAFGLVKIGVPHHVPVFDVSLDEIIPDNLFVMFERHNVVAIVVFALIFGYLVTELPEAEQKFMAASLKSVFSLFLLMAELLMQLLPFVVWAFVLGISSQDNPLQTIELLGGYLLCVLLANAVQGLLVLPAMLAYYKVSVVNMIKAVWPALMMAAITKSSTATLPLTMRCVKEKTAIDPERSKVILPLCCTVNMNACAAFIYITVLFVSQINGIDFSLLDQVVWIALSVIAAFGNAGVPMGCYFMATAYLVNMNVPTDMMGLILPFYAFIDMVETPLNIWSDVSILAVIDRKSRVQTDPA